METSLLGRATFGGLASGFDTNALLEGLLNAERQPLLRIQSRRSEIDSQRGLMRQLNSKLLDLRRASQALDNRNTAGTDASTEEEFLRYAGSSSNEDIVTVTAGIGASPGDIDVVVSQLATGSREFSTVFASDTDRSALTSGQSFTIDLPNADPDAAPPIEATSITVTAGADGLSLQDIRDQINTSADNAGSVRADILRVDDGEFRLVLTSTGTGDSNQLSISGDLLLAADDPGEENAESFRQTAENAVLTVFGQQISRETNLIDDVLPGVTLKLEALSDLVDEDEVDPGVDSERLAETVTIEADIDEIAKQLDTFVKAYNDVMSFIDGQFRYDDVSKRSGPLAGDLTLRQVQSQLRDIVSDGYSFTQNPNNPFAPSDEGASGGAISNIGIEIQGGGRLRVDKETLEEALALDPRSVREFLSGRVGPNPDTEVGGDVWEEGFATRIANSLERVVRSGDGTLANRDKAFESRIRDFDDSIERFERRLGQREETLVQRFAELERIVAGLQGQQGFLTSLG